MFTKSENHNENYLAQIVRIGMIEPIENSDHLVKTIVQGNIVVTSNNVKTGDIMIYFPVECQIESWFLAQNNLYKDKSLNKDSEKGGFIEKNGRVRCLKLRNQASQGLIMPIHSLSEVVDDSFKAMDSNVGVEFDTFCGLKLVSKYVVPVKIENPASKPVRCQKIKKMVEGQFAFHISTPQLGKNIDKLNPNSLISITRKMHGTSGIASHVICNVPVHKPAKVAHWVCKNIVYPIANLFSKNPGGSELVTTDYDYLYSSRTVIKNNSGDSGFYGVDVWKYAYEIIKPLLKKGMSVYYEIVGYLPSGKMIQKGYSYGYTQPSNGEEYKYNVHFGIRVYRITITNVDGDVYEFSAKQVQRFCQDRMLVPVLEYYYGYAQNLYPRKPDMSVDQWKDSFLEFLKLAYLEKEASDCGVGVPDEGIVIRVEDSDLEVYKLKSFKFLERETKELDSGETNIEDNGEQQC